jgi:DNA-binding transcriptional ArsR family regulator
MGVLRGSEPSLRARGARRYAFDVDRKVVEFRLGSADVSTIRFGISPGQELAHAVRALVRPQDHPLQWGWLAEARERVPAEPFRLLATVVGAEGYLPDFLTSPPDGEMTPERERDRIAHVRADRLRRDLEKMVVRSLGPRQQELRRLADAPVDDTRRRLADAWAEVWDSVLAPAWPQLLRLLRADIAVRARRSGESGLADMIDTLHSTVSWGGDAVRVQMRHHAEIVDCDGTGLLLVPSVMMSARGCAVVTEEPSGPMIFYPASGVSETWHLDGAAALDALTALFGAGRARLLLALQQPLSTSECADVAGLAVSTASHHLTVLREVGLVDSRRDGARVLHARTPTGEALAGVPRNGG